MKKHKTTKCNATSNITMLCFTHASWYMRVSRPSLLTFIILLFVVKWIYVFTNQKHFSINNYWKFINLFLNCFFRPTGFSMDTVSCTINLSILPSIQFQKTMVLFKNKRNLKHFWSVGGHKSAWQTESRPVKFIASTMCHVKS